MKDRVYVEGLVVPTLIGVYEFERHAEQDLILDLSLSYDCLPAGQTDDISKALDYDKLSRQIRQWAGQQTFELIETFAEQLCALIHREFGIESIELRINKPAAVDNCRAVGIHIHRNFGG